MKTILQRDYLQESALLDLLPAAVYTCDESGVITLYNRHAAELWGRTPALGDTDERFCGSFRLFWPDGRPLPHAETPMAEALRTGRSSRGEVVIERPDGSRILAMVNIAALRDESGALIGAVNCFVDVTEHRRLQMRLEEAERLDAIGRLAGGVAHEVNNQILVVLACADFISRHRDLPRTIRDDAEQIRRAGDRAATVTSQLLAFGRRQLLKPARLDLNEVATGLAPMVGRLLGPTIQLVLRLDAEPTWTWADQGQVERALLNLLLNAGDAMPDGGTLTIRTERVVYTTRTPLGAAGDNVEPGSYVTLTIGDTGEGMEPAVLRHVFEPFFTTKPIGRGTGLGLASVYGVVQQSGGAIGVDSAPGQGTTFRICLPLHEAEVATAAPKAPATDGAARPSGETVLVAEDEPGVRATLVRTLAEAGFAVVEAADGLDALRLAQDGKHIDLVVTDVAMPRMSGHELAERLAASGNTIPVLFVSGRADLPLGAPARRAGDGALLMKPFSPDDLVERVRAILGNRAL